MKDKVSHVDFSCYTNAALRIRAEVDFAGHTAGDVFDILGDPSTIPDWFLLARSVAPRDEAGFTVDFVFFGTVEEEILHWDPPRCYVYRASGPDFPILDYVAVIEIEEHGDRGGCMRWSMYFDRVTGAEYARIWPVMLPPIVAASMYRLGPLIGGRDYRLETPADAQPLFVAAN